MCVSVCVCVHLCVCVCVCESIQQSLPYAFLLMLIYSVHGLTCTLLLMFLKTGFDRRFHVVFVSISAVPIQLWPSHLSRRLPMKQGRA